MGPHLLLVFMPICEDCGEEVEITDPDVAVCRNCGLRWSPIVHEAQGTPI